MTGVGLLARLALRRDRVLVTVWGLLLVVVCFASAVATDTLYTTAAERVAAARAINASPAVVALYGPILDVRSDGELAMTKLTVLYAVFLAALVVVVVRRHTRTEEESGRAELVAGTAVSRQAALVAAVIEGAAVSVVVGLLAAAADVAGGLPVAGSLLFGLSWVGVGLVATGITALACQLSASTRTCAAITAGALAVLFLVRAVGDLSVPWLGWLSPFGWGTRLSAWSEPRWWVLLLYAVAAAALVLAAIALRARRDLGAGLVAARPGPGAGSPRLAGAVALALRLHAAALLTWSVALAAGGVVLGAIAPSVGDLLHTPDARRLVQRLGGQGALQDALLAAELSVVALLVTCFALSVVGRGAAEEHDGRTEQVLATATSRVRAYAATVVVAVLGSAWLLVVSGLAVLVGYSAAGGPGTGRVLGAALAQAPAVWLVVAFAVAAYAVRSRLGAAGWALFAGFVTLGELGELLRLPHWLIDLSPYVHVPRLPGAAPTLTPLAVMTALAAAVLGLGLLAYRRRDIG